VLSNVTIRTLMVATLAKLTIGSGTMPPTTE
jgi:hypothetical protein